MLKMIAELRTDMAEFRTELHTDIAEFRTELKSAQTLVLACAVKAIIAIDGDKTERREFVSNAENALRGAERGEDCKSGCWERKRLHRYRPMVRRTNR